MTRLDLYVSLLALSNIVVVVEVLRRRRLSETFALVWLAVGVLGLVIGLARSAVDELAEDLGLVTGTSLVFSGAILFLMIVCLVLSSQVTRLRDDVETLAEEIALLRGAEPPLIPRSVSRDHERRDNSGEREGADRPDHHR